MLKENNHLTEAIIQLLESLPETQRKKVMKTVSRKRKTAKRAGKSYREKADALIADMKKTRGRLPSGYRFDREEANAR